MTGKARLTEFVLLRRQRGKARRQPSSFVPGGNRDYARNMRFATVPIRDLAKIEHSGRISSCGLPRLATLGHEVRFLH
jgi:hypothetical protein